MGHLRFAGHICRMDPSSFRFRIFNYKPIQTRTRDGPKFRWANCVGNDFKVLRVYRHYKAARGLLVTALVILNHGQVARTTSELAACSPNIHTSSMAGRLSLDKFYAQRPPLHSGSSAALVFRMRYYRIVEIWSI
ncbi:hypothetical protein TNCV_488531 [Trichonephila clavipes]|nr:hypothetical protein TNCV_488531 [Trichonephila clavipes]